jgi:hypothetical protein
MSSPNFVLVFGNIRTFSKTIDSFNKLNYLLNKKKIYTKWIFLVKKEEEKEFNLTKKDIAFKSEKLIKPLCSNYQNKEKNGYEVQLDDLNFLAKYIFKKYDTKKLTFIRLRYDLVFDPSWVLNKFSNSIENKKSIFIKPQHFPLFNAVSDAFWISYDQNWIENLKPKNISNIKHKLENNFSTFVPELAHFQVSFDDNFAIEYDYKIGLLRSSGEVTLIGGNKLKILGSKYNYLFRSHMYICKKEIKRSYFDLTVSSYSEIDLFLKIIRSSTVTLNDLNLRLFKEKKINILKTIAFLKLSFFEKLKIIFKLI